MVEDGVWVAGVNLWARGAKAMRLPLRRIGEGLSPFPFVLDFPQDLHERFLLERLNALGVQVERSTEFVRFDTLHAMTVSERISKVRMGPRRPSRRHTSRDATAHIPPSGRQELLRE
jgi:hypothetical protein